MSKLARALVATTTGERFYPMKYLSVHDPHDQRPGIDMDRGHVYTLGASFRVEIRSTELEVSHGIHARRVEMARRQVLHEVFGEFVGPLYEAEFAAMNYDGERAAKLIRQVIESFESTSDTP